jgi:thioredoxin 1
MTDQNQQTNQTPKGAVHLTTDDFEKTIQEAGTPVFVDFYAEWCGPCKLAAPIVDKLSEELKGKVLIAKVDTDENNELAKQFGVMSIPTVLILQKDGDKIKELDRKIGFPGEAGYRQMLAKVMPQDQQKVA